MLADVLLKIFIAAAVFGLSYFLNVVEEFRSCLSKPNTSSFSFYVSTNFLLCFLYDFS